VELLVRRRRGPDDVVVDASAGDRLEDRVAGGRIAEEAPADEQGALGVRVAAPQIGGCGRCRGGGQTETLSKSKKRP